ncbi:21480_t:CDS:1, partial [Gigaspora rosea]
MESQSSANLEFCTGCKKYRPAESFQKNNKISKTCSTCRETRNMQNAQKHEVMDTSISRITMEDLFRILKAMKGQTIENLKQIIDI